MDKARNKFVLDNIFASTKFWKEYAKRVANPADAPLQYDFWDWAIKQSWPSCALPELFVSASYNAGTISTLPFARMQKETPKYSLPSMMVAYWQAHNGNPTTCIIPREEIDFSRFLNWEAPILEDQNCYNLVSDMPFISKLCEFGNPRAIILDYCSRTGHVPTSLRLRDLRGPATLEMMKRVWNQPFSGYDWATWYTRTPCPVKAEWNETLRRNLPIFHLDIIVALDMGEDVDTVTALIETTEIVKFPQRNAAWWKRKTGRQKRSIKSRMKQSGSTLSAAAVLPKPEDFLMNVNMEDVHELWLLANPEIAAAEITETPQEGRDWEAPQVDIDFDALLLAEPTSSKSEEQWDSEGEQDEQALIAAALDRYGYPSSDEEG